MPASKRIRRRMTEAIEVANPIDSRRSAEGLPAAGRLG
jgi:hypothetical protein